MDSNLLIYPHDLFKKGEENDEEKKWSSFVKTFPDADYENIWQSLFIMCDLFRETAIWVANHFGYDYPYDDDRRVTNHLKYVKALPKDANELY